MAVSEVIDGIALEYIVQVVQGCTMLNNWSATRVGWEMLEERIREMLKEYGYIKDGEEKKQIDEEDWKMIEVSGREGIQ